MTSLQELAAQICALAGIATPELSADADGVLAFTLSLNEVEATLTHDPIEHPDQLTIHVFFGQVPEDKELAVLRELLQANLEMRDPGAPVFGFNARTRDAVLRCTRSLADACAEELWPGLQDVIAMALEWREHFFLTPISIFHPPAAIPDLSGRLRMA